MTKKRWDARKAIATLPHLSWNSKESGDYVWRVHFDAYSATDYGGSYKTSGRFNKESLKDESSQHLTWPALYLGTQPDVCIGEYIRNHEPKVLQNSRHILTKMSLRLERILDCRNLTALGLTEEELLHDNDYAHPHDLAQAALEGKFEAILVPSATRLGECIVIFPTNLSRDDLISFPPLFTSKPHSPQYLIINKLNVIHKYPLKNLTKCIPRQKTKAMREEDLLTSTPVITGLDDMAEQKLREETRKKPR
jgi:RES domain-containing protein